MDLVDDLGEGRLWWGDKGVSGDGNRVAGTAGAREKVGGIDPDAFYM